MSAKFPRVFLRSSEEAEILRGFPWVYGNEIASVAGEAADGDAIEAFSSAGLFLGTGILNRKSKIALRLLCHDRAETLFDSARGVHTDRAASAASLRAAYYSPADSYRLCFAEADGFSGLIVERFADTGGRFWYSSSFPSRAKSSGRNCSPRSAKPRIRTPHTTGATRPSAPSKGCPKRAAGSAGSPTSS